MKPSTNPMLRIGIDIGGTFTDFVVFDPIGETLISFKILSTPKNPAEAVLQGLQKILSNSNAGEGVSFEIIHGSTIATNALLERKGARTVLITTRGFKDVIEIGRQNRKNLYDLVPQPKDVLIPSELRLEITERVGVSGNILTPLDNRSKQNILQTLVDLQPESIAVCFLFSFANPVHEQEIAECLRNRGYTVSLSSEILPEYREYERFSTTCINAYVSPILDKYLRALDNSLAQIAARNGVKSNLRIIQSNGGIMRIDEARRNGVRCLLSGPAGGVIGAYHIGQLISNAKSRLNPNNTKANQPILSFDMGGTSTDVSVILNEPSITSEATVGGFPIRIPVIDIHTIGAGGGSIAYTDAGGVLRVGPQSAGADPGPACYGKGILPTVTDANLVLGRLKPDYFLGGQMEISQSRAENSITQLGTQIEIGAGDKLTLTALGILDIVNAHMERALRVISVERGYDPHDFILLSFGGAGGLHAADLARNLGIPKVLVPPLASTLSAYGMLDADIVRDYLQTVMLPGDTFYEDVKKAFLPLVEQGTQDLFMEGYPSGNIIFEHLLYMRYKGQSYEICIPFTESYLRDFQLAHYRAYGILYEGGEVEIVNIRVRVIGKVPPIPISTEPQISSDPTHAMRERCNIIFSSGNVNSPIYLGEALLPGNIIAGPALITRADTSILIGLSDSAWIDGFRNIHIDIGVL